MGVRIQELPETTGIKKEDVLIVEDGQGTKKGTVQQLDEALGVSQLKEDLSDLDSRLSESKIDKPKTSDDNKFPRAKNGDVEWVEQGMPTDEQTSNAINNWLNAHPEATTTVQDRSLTENKFTDELKKKTIKDYVTPEMFGAVGDGVTDDTEALKRSISYSNENNKLLLGTGKSYLITKDITLSCNFNLNHSTIISDGLKITLKRSCELTNGVLYNTHILIDGPLVKLDTITFKNFTLSAITLNAGSYEPFISNIRIETNVSSVDTVAITCNTDDATFSKVYGYGAHKGIINNGADNYYEDIHLWLNYFNVFDGSVFITNKGGAVFFTNCCCDSYETFYTETLKYLTTRIDNCHWLNNNSIFKGKTFTLFDIPESHDGSYLQGSLIVDIPSASSNNKVNIGNQFTNVKLTNYNGNFSDFKTYLNRDLLQQATNVTVSLLESSMATSNCLTYFGYVTNGENRIIIDLKKFLYIAKIKKKQLLTDIVIQKENESTKDGKALVTIENGLITIEPYLSSAEAVHIWSVWMTIYY